MKGNMMSWGLTIPKLIEHAEKYFCDNTYVSRSSDGAIQTYKYGDSLKNSKKLAGFLRSNLDIALSDRVATIAWNDAAHFETYFAACGMGAVLHTINPRLFPEQLIYIINHAEDKVLFVDPMFLPLIEGVYKKLYKEIPIIVFTTDQVTSEIIKNIYSYGDILASDVASIDWVNLDEDSAASLCYTSGTTGNPKGVMYSHKSTVLHTWAAANSIGATSQSSILPVVPMFHVNAWGTPYIALLTGVKLLLPGPALDGASLHELIKKESPNILMGVPTVWLGLLNYLSENDLKLSGVEQVMVGGSAAPYAMIKDFNEKHDIFLTHGWGMTEMSPLGTMMQPTPKLLSLDKKERYEMQTRQGYPLFGVEIKTVDEKGNELPRDGNANGALKVRGPWIMDSYYKDDAKAVDDEGWFDTGDVATIFPDGCMQIVDRAKDVIKSGGEWISSIDLENAAVGYPEVQEACVVGVPHPKWDERPLLLVVADESTLNKDDLLKYLESKVAKWWLPDDIICVRDLPHGATGKLLKVELRAQYKNYLMEK